MKKPTLDHVKHLVGRDCQASPVTGQLPNRLRCRIGLYGIKTPVKQPTDGSRLAPDNRAYNRLLRGLRWQGERGFAILVGRWKTLRHTTVSPRRIGDIVAAALHLTHFEYKYLPESR